MPDGSTKKFDPNTAKPFEFDSSTAKSIEPESNQTDIKLSEKQRLEAVQRAKSGVLQGLEGLTQPVEQVQQGIQELNDNPLAGATKIGLGITNTLFNATGIPVALMAVSHVAKKVGASQAAELFDGAMRLPSDAVDAGTKAIDKGLEFINLGKENQFKLIQNMAILGVSMGLPTSELITEEGQKKLSESLDEFNKLGATILSFHALGAGKTKLFGEDVKPIKDITPKSPKTSLEPQGKEISKKPSKTMGEQEIASPGASNKAEILAGVENVEVTEASKPLDNPFRSWLQSKSNVTIIDKENLGITGKGQKIGAYTQRTENGFNVTVAKDSPPSSYAKEIGRVLSHETDFGLIRMMKNEYKALGYTKGATIDNFASAVKDVLTIPEARAKAPRLTKLLEKNEVPFSDINQNPIGTPESLTAKTNRQRAEISENFQSPITGQSHFDSMSKFTTDAELNDYLTILGSNEKSRGIMTKDVVDDLAAQLGMKQSDILKVKKGETRNVEQLRGMKQVIADNLLEMDKFRKDKGAVLTATDAKQLKNMYLTHVAMIAKVKGLVTESARALQEMNRPVSAREFDILSDVQKTLNSSNEPIEPTLANTLRTEKMYSLLTEVFNLPRVALTSFDMSMPFRQGKLLMIANPKSAIQNFSKMHKAFVSEEYYRNIEQELAGRTNANLYEQTKLFLTERDAAVTRTGNVEEVFYGNKIAEKIPLVGEVVKGSERAAATFMNLMRADTFDMFAERFKQNGHTYENNPKLYNDLAWMIDKMSMRGDIGKAERLSGIFNSIFFSIRNQTAKIQLFTSAITGKKIFDPKKGEPVEYYKLAPEIRKEIMNTAAKDIGLTLAALGIAKTLGASVETDPRSSDFLKMKIGNMRIDPFAGWQQYMVFATQFALDQKKNIQTGEIISSDQFPFESRMDKAIQFARKKLAPTISIPVDWAYGKDVMGVPFDKMNDVKILGNKIGEIPNQLQKSILPMALSDFYSAVDEAGILGTLAGAYSFYGGGVQVYDEKQKKQFKQPKPITTKKRKVIKFGSNNE